MTLRHGFSYGGTEDENRYQSNTFGENNQNTYEEVADNDATASTDPLSFHRRCGELITLSSNSNTSATNSFSVDSGRR